MFSLSAKNQNKVYGKKTCKSALLYLHIVLYLISLSVCIHWGINLHYHEIIHWKNGRKSISLCFYALGLLL